MILLGVKIVTNSTRTNKERTIQMKLKLDKAHASMLIPNIVVGIATIKDAEESEKTDSVVSDTMTHLLEHIMDSDLYDKSIELNKNQQLFLLTVLCSGLHKIMSDGIEKTTGLIDKYYGTDLLTRRDPCERRAIYLSYLMLEKFECEVDSEVYRKYARGKLEDINKIIRNMADEMEAIIEENN